MRHPFLRTLAGTTTDPNFENVTLLLHGDGTNGGQNNTFVDGSTNNFTITRNGNTTQGTFSPYGDNWSNYFDGNGDYLSLTGQSLASGDWTIECWVYFQSFTNAGPHIFDFGTDSTNRYVLWRNESSGKFEFVTVNNNTFDFKPGTTSPVIGTWYHVAVVRSSGTTKLYVNGTSEATSTTAINGGTNWRIGHTISGNTASTYYLLGYISNFRVVTSAVYTTNFTPPTAPLTAITNTSLLTCSTNRFRDVSSNNRTITRNGDVSVQRFSPFSPTAAYAAGTIGGSGYFDGNGDDVSFPTSTAFELGTSDFTVEGWLYPSSLADGNTAFVLDSSFYPRIMWIRDAGAFRVYASTTGSSWSITHTVGVIVSQWNHLVFQRDGNNFRTFLNGTLVTTTTTSLTFPAQRSVGYVGRGDSTSQRWPGYIADMRVVKGTAVYSTSGFTPPTAPLTAITNTSLLLNFQNAAILDNAMMAVPETVGNAQIDTTTKKYGTGSLEFDGTGDWLLIPDSPDQRLGTGNFTIECWLYLSATGTARGIVGKGTSTTGWLLSTTTSNAVVFTYGTSTITSTGTLSGTTWYHIAVVREGTGSNQTKIYIGGTNDGTGTVSTDFTQTNAAYVGANRTGGDPMNGYIDDLRITKGVARYTANFTAPTAAFPDL